MIWRCLALPSRRAAAVPGAREVLSRAHHSSLARELFAPGLRVVNLDGLVTGCGLLVGVVRLNAPCGDVTTGKPSWLILTMLVLPSCDVDRLGMKPAPSLFLSYA